MGDITLTASDGHTLSAYRAGPEDAPAGLVVVQEIFGVNHHMRQVCDAFAEAGYAVVSPALFDRAERGVQLGYAPEDVARGVALRGKIANGATMLDIAAAAAALRGKKLGIVGYCWGGTVAWWGTTRSKDFSAAVGWYGGGIAATREEVPNCPVQLHFGGIDASIPMLDVRAIRDAQPDVEVFVYDSAGHGFGCDERGSYSARDADEAQTRTLEFFGRCLA